MYKTDSKQTTILAKESNQMFFATKTIFVSNDTFKEQIIDRLYATKVCQQYLSLGGVQDARFLWEVNRLIGQYTIFVGIIKHKEEARRHSQT